MQMKINTAQKEYLLLTIHYIRNILTDAFLPVWYYASFRRTSLPVNLITVFSVCKSWIFYKVFLLLDSVQNSSQEFHFVIN